MCKLNNQPLAPQDEKVKPDVSKAQEQLEVKSLNEVDSKYLAYEKSIADDKEHSQKNLDIDDKNSTHLLHSANAKHDAQLDLEIEKIKRSGSNLCNEGTQDTQDFQNEQNRVEHKQDKEKHEQESLLLTIDVPVNSKHALENNALSQCMQQGVSLDGDLELSSIHTPSLQDDALFNESNVVLDELTIESSEDEIIIEVELYRIPVVERLKQSLGKFVNGKPLLANESTVLNDSKDSNLPSVTEDSHASASFARASHQDPSLLEHDSCHERVSEDEHSLAYQSRMEQDHTNGDELTFTQAKSDSKECEKIEESCKNRVNSDIQVLSKVQENCIAQENTHVKTSSNVQVSSSTQESGNPNAAAHEIALAQAKDLQYVNIDVVQDSSISNNHATLLHDNLSRVNSFKLQTKDIPQGVAISEHGEHGIAITITHANSTHSIEICCEPKASSLKINGEVVLLQSNEINDEARGDLTEVHTLKEIHDKEAGTCEHELTRSKLSERDGNKLIYVEQANTAHMQCTQNIHQDSVKEDKVDDVVLHQHNLAAQCSDEKLIKTQQEHQQCENKVITCEPISHEQAAHEHIVKDQSTSVVDIVNQGLKTQEHSGANKDDEIELVESNSAQATKLNQKVEIVFKDHAAQSEEAKLKNLSDAQKHEVNIFLRIYRNELFRRYLIFFAAVAIGAFGITLVTRAAIGTNSVAVVAYVTSQFCPLSMGTVTILIHLLMQLGQMMLLNAAQRRKRLTVTLLQIPAFFTFGILTDLFMWLTEGFNPLDYGYLCAALVFILGSVIVGLNIAMQAIANVTMLASDAFVIILANKINKEIGSVKFAYDLGMTAIAALISLLCSNFSMLIGVREGSIIGSFITGPTINFFLPKLAFLSKWMLVYSAKPQGEEKIR